MDNWFTNMDVLNSLFTDFKLNLLGTIRKNKKDLPREFARPPDRPVSSNVFAIRKNYTLTLLIETKMFHFC